MIRNDDPTIRKQEISYGIDSSRDILKIYLLTIDVIPAKKFVRKKEKRITVSKIEVAKHAIEIPFTERRWVEKQWRDYSKFHQDSEEIEVERYEKKYAQPQLNDFVNEKVNFYTKKLITHT